MKQRKALCAGCQSGHDLRTQQGMEDSGVTVRADTTIQDRYQLQHLLGAGGFGQVWKATDRTLEREVAVKFATSIAGDPQAVARFTAEARKLARLHHRGIVTVHDAGTVADDGHAVPYLVMELLNGSTWQQSSSVESVDSVVRTGASLAEALAYMHEMGIVHRDIKPANIMICGDGKAVLMDLGIARDFSALTTVTAAVSPGTLAYMAPEQFAGSPASAASDVYALGLVLIEKITGKRGPAAQLPATDRAALTPHLRALLDRMTALDPGERPSAAECREQLGQPVLSREPARAESLTPRPAPESPGRRAQWERYGPPAAVFVLVNVSSDFWLTNLGAASVWVFLVWLVRFLVVGLLVFTAVLTPHSKRVTRGVGYVFASFNAIGFVLGVTTGGGPTLAHNLPLFCTAIFLSIAAYCYRDITTRRARSVSPQHIRQLTSAPQPAAPVGESTPTPITRTRRERADMAASEGEIIAGLAEIMYEIAGVPVEDVQLDKSFMGDLDVDSLSMVEAVVAAEERFNVRIPDDDGKNLKTVRDATHYILKAQRSR
ncbi:acyl carrier protein [Streptomyces goshikiensis]|uniref:acyl carrier protein n=1 Tax=Streptomyces goshikiensis TaxID=1942 RepID=UPI0036532AA1